MQPGRVSAQKELEQQDKGGQEGNRAEVHKITRAGPRGSFSLSPWEELGWRAHQGGPGQWFGGGHEAELAHWGGSSW